MIGIGILLFAAALAYGAAHALKVPAIPLLLITGVGLAVTGLLPAELLEDTLVLGTTILVFVTGMELSPKRTRTQRQAAARIGGLQFLMLGAVGLSAAVLLGYGVMDAAYIALALTASSTLVVVRLLQRRRQLFEPFGRLVLGVLLLQDVLVLLLIPVITELPNGPLAVIRGLAATIALGLLALLTFRYVSPLIEKFDGEDETMLLVLLAVLFLFVGLADLLALPIVTGAFLGGVSLARFPLASMARTQLGSIAEFFSALFFIVLGAFIGIPSPTELLHGLTLALVVILVTPPLVTIIAERAGMSSRPAIESALLLSQTSEISLVLGLYGYLAGQISESVFTIIAIVTLLTMLATPFLTAERVVWWLMRRRPNRLLPQRRRLDRAIPESGHVVVLGSGSTGMPLLETILSTGLDIVVIDDDPVVVRALREADIACLRGDASDVALLRRANAQHARIITSTIRRPADNRRLLEMARGVTVLVRVFDESDAAWIREMGGTPILASHAAADEMMRWFDREMGRAGGVAADGVSSGRGVPAGPLPR